MEGDEEGVVQQLQHCLLELGVLFDAFAVEAPKIDAFDGIVLWSLLPSWILEAAEVNRAETSWAQDSRNWKIVNAHFFVTKWIDPEIFL